MSYNNKSLNVKQIAEIGTFGKKFRRLLEKMSVLNRVDRALQSMLEFEHPNLDRGKEVACNTNIQHLTMNSSEVFEGGGGFEAI